MGNGFKHAPLALLVCGLSLTLPDNIRAAPLDDAMFALVSGDATKAMKMLQSLADSGDVQAQIFLGETYRDGTGGVPKDYQEALKWFRIVADKGEAVGQYDLGTAYRIGEGVRQNSAEALRLYRLAASQGYSKAQVQVAQAYLRPGSYELKDIEENPKEGVKWLRLAAEQGDGDGQGLLGLMYEDGKGVHQDYVLAYMWESLAISSTMSKKGKYFADEVRTMRDELIVKMTKAQIEQGRKLADNWKPAGPSTPVTIGDPSHALTACYRNSAKAYGAQTCQPPAGIVGAVFGSCAKEEDAFKTDLRRQYPNNSELVEGGRRFQQSPTVSYPPGRLGKEQHPKPTPATLTMTATWR